MHAGVVFSHRFSRLVVLSVFKVGGLLLSKYSGVFQQFVIAFQFPDSRVVLHSSGLNEWNSIQLYSWWSKKPSPEHSWFIGQGSCSCNVLLACARQHGEYGSSARLVCAGVLCRETTEKTLEPASSFRRKLWLKRPQSNQTFI